MTTVEALLRQALEYDNGGDYWLVRRDIQHALIAELDRNTPVAPDMGNPISSDLQQRMVALVRRLVGGAANHGNADYLTTTAERAALAEARAIVADPGFPVEVDGDLVEARALIADAVLYGQGIVGDPERKRPSDFRDGTCDAGDLVSRALGALRRGKQMAEEA